MTEDYRFVRTKDGIVESTQTVRTSSIIAKANTVKELCDEFIVAYENGSRIVYSDLDWAKAKATTSLKFGDKSTIYGSIWVDKDLIHVAEVNGYGELELLRKGGG